MQNGTASLWKRSAFVFGLFVAVAVLIGVHPLTTYAAPASPAVNQCNGTDNVGGQAVVCDVTITNNLNLATGAVSSTVTTNDCHGAAGAPPVITCIPLTQSFPTLTTSVTQCDGSGLGGGANVICSVTILNIITGTITPTAATVDQCVGSGTGGGGGSTMICDPFPASTTNATVTQCNGSGNGGGGTIRVQCTVGPSTITSALPVTVDQCNGSGNGGGATVTCTVSIRNTILASTTPVTRLPVVSG
ncbi:MAG TPA: hypothetical protein DCP11_07920 [Microbacteriaceae bacterium]|jgi:hypothetical protein|nr:hypothetical protein [Microbacteriaceae bacterium]